MVLEGGTLASSAGAWLSLLVRPVFGWVGNVVGIGWLVVGTLLGPEGAGCPVCPGCLLSWLGLPVSHTAGVPMGVPGLVGAWGGCLVVR